VLPFYIFGGSSVISSKLAPSRINTILLALFPHCSTSASRAEPTLPDYITHNVVADERGVLLGL